MNNRLAIALILGMSLFYACLYLQQGDLYRAEAQTNIEDTAGRTDDLELGDTSDETANPEPTQSPEGTITPAPTNTPGGTATPAPTNTPGGTATSAPTNTPAGTATPAPTNTPKRTATPKPTKRPIQRGWNKTVDGKKFYIQKNGKRAKGYKTIGGSNYYFNNRGYAITKQWKYIKIHGKKYKLYFGKNGKRKLDVTKQLKSNASFRIEVNLSKNMIMIYAKDGKQGYTIPVKAMICSVGMPGHRTITGNYNRLSRAGSWHVLRYNSVGQYCTRISGPYLFHSVVYTRYGDKYSLHKAEYQKLGKSASHGCIRLQVEDAKWIYDRANRCQVSLYYDKTAKYPLKRPKAKKIGKTEAKRYYDPTDPKISTVQ